MVLEQLDARRQREGGGTEEELWYKSHTLNKNEHEMNHRANWKSQTIGENLHGLGLFRQGFSDMAPKAWPGHEAEEKKMGFKSF